MYNLAGIAVLVLLLAVGAAYLIDELGKAGKASAPSLEDADPIVQTISGRELSIPTAWFRYGEQIRDGFTNQIDLRILFAPDAEQPAIPGRFDATAAQPRPHQRQPAGRRVPASI